MGKYWIALGVLIVIGGYCLYAAIFLAWVTATPAEVTMRTQAHHLAQWWSAGLGLVLLAITAIIVRMVVLARNAS
jgi:hypothetical protein